MRTYLTVLCSSIALALGAVAALNYVVDPYLIHQWDSAQVRRLRPAREKLSAWGKTYALARYRPSIVYIGNSRTELGLEADLPVFGGAAVFNAALSGASLGDAVAMAEHAMRVSRLDTVVWGIDAPSFSTVLGTRDFDRALVAGEAEGANRYFARRVLINIQRGLTVDMTQDAIGVLSGSFGAVCRSALAFRGKRDDDCIAEHMAGLGGTRAAVAPRLREFVRGEGPTEGALATFDAALEQLCARRVRLRVYLNPTHAIMHEALYWRGKWAALERWEIALAQLADAHRARGCDLRLYDFSGFNSVTTEPLPAPGSRAAMRYYWEPSHYRANVGRMVMDRLLGGAADGADVAPADFGVELTTPIMAAQLARQRALRDAYRASHAADSGLARALARAEDALPAPAAR